MAERTTTPVAAPSMREVTTYQCLGLTFTTTDTMQPLELANFTEKCLQVYGTFGTGGSITFYGSNDAADLVLQPDNAASGWCPLTDPQGNAITKTAKAIEEILENPRYITAKVTAGDGTTNLKVFITCKRSI